MSAAEKLKALETTDGLGNPIQTYPQQQALYAALPQIVAVVEAAELEAALAIINDDRETSLGAALAALDEALGDNGAEASPTPERT